jgi:hypothetical protein
MLKINEYKYVLMASLLAAAMRRCWAQIPKVNTTTSFYPASPTLEEQQSYNTCALLLEEAFNETDARGLDAIVYDQWKRVNPGPYLFCMSLGLNSTVDDDLRVLHPFVEYSTVADTLEKSSEDSSPEFVVQQEAFYKMNREYCLSNPNNETLSSNYNYFHQKKSQDVGVLMLKDDERYLLVGCGVLDTPLDVKGHETIDAGNPVYCACAYTNIPVSEPRVNTNLPKYASSSMGALKIGFLVMVVPALHMFIP